MENRGDTLGTLLDLGLSSEQVPISLPSHSLGAAGNQLNPLVSSSGLYLYTWQGGNFEVSISI